MTQDKSPGKADPSMQPETTRAGRKARPEWADGLRQLYDSVVNEPLPDSFADLISKLDDTGK
ncbi:NepR family anti-sigma factor [Novosphingobium flavum]